MNKVFFFSVLSLVLAISCQKEVETTQTTVETVTPLTLESVNEVIDQIDFENLQVKHEILQFVDTEHWNTTLDLLERANKKYHRYFSQRDNDLPSERGEYDGFYVTNQFAEKFDGFINLHTSPGVKSEFFNALPKFIKTILNQNNEVFIGDTYHIYFDNGESLEIEAPSFDEIIIARREGTNFASSNRGVCNLSKSTNSIRIVNYCGAAYVYQNGVSYFNVGNIHRVDAYTQCYELGDLGNFIDFGNVTTKVNGLLSIDCTNTTISIQDASPFNSNLVNGKVPYFDTCEGCGNTLVTVAYNDVITMNKTTHFIEGLFYMEFDAPGCNEVLFEEMNLYLEFE